MSLTTPTPGGNAFMSYPAFFEGITGRKPFPYQARLGTEPWPAEQIGDAIVRIYHASGASGGHSPLDSPDAGGPTTTGEPK